jgi:hypothetical protein
MAVMTVFCMLMLLKRVEGMVRRGVGWGVVGSFLNCLKVHEVKFVLTVILIRHFIQILLFRGIKK